MQCLAEQIRLQAALVMMLVIGMFLGATIQMQTSIEPLGPKKSTGLIFNNEGNRTMFVDVYVMNGDSYDKMPSIYLELGAQKNLTIKWYGDQNEVTVFAHYTDPAGNELDTDRYIIDKNTWYSVFIV